MQASEPLIRKSQDTVFTLTTTSSPLVSQTVDEQPIENIFKNGSFEVINNSHDVNNMNEDHDGSSGILADRIGNELIHQPMVVIEPSPIYLAKNTSIETAKAKSITDVHATSVQENISVTSSSSNARIKENQCPSIGEIVANVRTAMETRNSGSVARLWPIPPPNQLDQAESLRTAVRERRHPFQSADADAFIHVNNSRSINQNNKADDGIVDDHESNFEVNANNYTQNRLSAFEKETSSKMRSNESNSIWTLFLDSSERLSSGNESSNWSEASAKSNHFQSNADKINWFETDNSSRSIGSKLSKTSSARWLSLSSPTTGQRSLAKRRIESLEPDDSEQTDDDLGEEPGDDELEQMISTTSTSSPLWYTSGARASSSSSSAFTPSRSSFLSSSGRSFADSTLNTRSSSQLSSSAMLSPPTLRSKDTSDVQRQPLGANSASKVPLDQDEELVYLAQLMPSDRLTQRSRSRIDPTRI